MRTKASELAGTWYPGEPRVLRAEIDRLLAAAPLAVPSPAARALVLPHAGYRYSGAAAAAGYAVVRAHTYARAVIVAPSHYASFRGAVVPEFDAFETPLGTTAIDAERTRALAAQPGCRSDEHPFAREHALEIHLPFVQVVLPAVPVVPILVGRLEPGDAAPLAQALAAVIDAATLCIISSDFVHYGRQFDYLPFPADDAAAVRERLRRLDGGAIERVCAGDAGAFMQYVRATGATICGRYAIALYLTMAAGVRGRLLTYYTSLDVTGDHEHCVSYAAIAFPAAPDAD